MSFSPLKKRSPEETFWNWFRSNSELYFSDIETNNVVLFERLENELSKVAKGLTFEFSAVKSNGKREFVISADGIRDLIPSVNRLVSTQPELKNWEIVAFRQRRENLDTIKYDVFEVNPKDIFFTYDKSRRHLTLYVRKYIENKEYVGILYTLLDYAIGEYDVMTKLTSVEIKILVQGKNENLYPLSQLPDILEED